MVKGLKVLLLTFLFAFISTSQVLAAGQPSQNTNFFDQINIIKILFEKINDLQNQINHLTKLLEQKEKITPTPTIAPTVISTITPTITPIPTKIPTKVATPIPTTVALPTVTFIASDANGHLFDTDTISVVEGSLVNFVYSSTNATNCYTYFNDTPMNSNDAGLTQGATSGKFGSMPRLAGYDGNYRVTCFNANGKKVSKSYKMNVTPSKPPEFNIRVDSLNYILDNKTIVTIGWNSIPGTVKYNVRRKLASENDYPNEVFVSVGGENLPFPNVTFSVDSLHDYKFKVSACKTADDCTNSINEISVPAKG